MKQNENCADGHGKFNPLVSLKTWWNAERIGRFEEGTSQDMCPTYGSCVVFFLIMAIAWTPLLIVLWIISSN